MRVAMKVLLAAAVLALAAPGAAAGARLSLVSHDVHGPQPARVARFDLVGIHWRGRGSVLFRTRSLVGRWSSWRAAAPGEDDLPDHGTAESRRQAGWHLGSPFWVGGADALQVRKVGRVTRVRAFFVRSGGRSRPVLQPLFTETPTIITRAQWGANEAIRRAQPIYADNVHFAVVHHTAGSNSYTASQSASIVRAIELYHVQGNGWNDIGYNFLVDKYGQVFEGRYGGITRAVIGAHAMGFNAGSVGVALIGNYNGASPTAAEKAALVSLLAWRLDLAHVDPLSKVVHVSAGNPRYPAGTAVTLNAISGHRDTYPTSCPGTNLYSQLPAIRKAVAATGLPKLYEPQVAGVLGGPVRFTARLSADATWTVTVKDQTGAVVASGTGTGAKVDWTWDATAANTEQQYAWTIAAPDMRSATGTIGPPLPPPTLKRVRIAPAFVLPNGSATAQQATLSYQLNTPSFVTATLVDSAGATVAPLFSRSRPAGTQTFVWKNVAVPDGRYRISLVAKNPLGQQVQAFLPVAVDRSVGSLAQSFAAFSPNGDGARDATNFAFRLFAPAHVQLQVRRGKAVVATLLDADLGPGPSRIRWDGGGLPDGSYSAVLSATDSLQTVQQPLALKIDRRAPVLRLISLRRLQFRLSEPARVTLVVDGRWKRLTLRKAVLFRAAGRVRHSLTAYAVDAAGNRSKVIRVRR
jgi:hypothetical protein